MDPKEQKKELRKLITSRRDAATQEQLRALSARVENTLFTFDKFKEAHTVMFFAAFRSEVHTVPMIARALAQGKRAVAPVSLIAERALLPCLIRDIEKDLVPGSYGIPETPLERRVPVAPQEIDFLCLPGLGFDRRGNRLGYGGGFYDRFLDRLRPDCTLAALAYAFQIVDHVAHAPHDKPVQFVITDQEVIACTG